MNNKTVIRCDCPPEFKTLGSGVAQHKNGDTFTFHFDACRPCLEHTFERWENIERSIANVNEIDRRQLERSFMLSGNEEMFQLAKTNFEYWVREINVD